MITNTAGITMIKIMFSIARLRNINHTGRQINTQIVDKPNP